MQIGRFEFVLLKPPIVKRPANAQKLFESPSPQSIKDRSGVWSLDFNCWIVPVVVLLQYI